MVGTSLARAGRGSLPASPSDRVVKLMLYKIVKLMLNRFVRL